MPNKSAQIRLLLEKGDSDGRKLSQSAIARILDVPINSVKRVGKAMRSKHAIQERLSRLEQDLRDLRALVVYKLDAAKYGVKTGKAQRVA